MTAHQIEKQERTAAAITREMLATRDERAALTLALLRTKHGPTRRALNERIADLEAAALARAYESAA